MPDLTLTPTELIHRALKVLAGVCDFAQKQDGIGFNAYDTAFGHELAMGGSLSAGQALVALKMLRKYQKQLAEYGITLPDTVETVNAPTARIEKGYIYLTFDGKPDEPTRTFLKSIGGRWNPDLSGLPWSVIHNKSNTAAIFEKWGINHLPEPTAQAAPVQQPPPAPKSRPEVQFTVKDNSILVTFPVFNRANVDLIKSLPERKWLPDEPGKPWAVPSRLAMQLVEMFPAAAGIEQLTDLANHQKELAEMSNKSTGATTTLTGLTGTLYPFQHIGVEFLEKVLGEKNFSRCPLYDIMSVEGDSKNAKRNLSTYAETERASNNQFSERSRKRSQGESDENLTEDCSKSRMEGQGFSGNETSNAQTGNTGKTPESTFGVPDKQRDEFQGGKRSGGNTDNISIKCPVIAKRMAERIPSENERAYYETYCSDILQGGLCISKGKISSGSGRELSQQTVSKNKGQEETRGFRESWLDCPAIETRISGHGALIADEPGLGKTIQAIAYLAQHPELRPAVIVVPASLKINWRNEITKWLSKPERVTVVSGTKTYDLSITGTSIAIINYDILNAWKEQVVNWKPAVVISDESHYLKSGNKSLRGKAMQFIAKSVSRIILLTGTPILNRPVELFPLLNMLNPHDWPNFFKYAMRYCNARQNGFGWDFTGASNLEELFEITRPYIIRRRKDQVLTELPPKVWANLAIEFDPAMQKEYQAEVARAEMEVAEMTHAQQLVMIEKLKQLAARAKLPGIITWITDFLETGEKLLIFATHHSTIHALENAFPDNSVTVTGETPVNKRQSIVERFQTDDNIKLFFGNIQAAGVGLTLTAASNVLFIEFPWRSGDLIQAADRTHRLGQENSVTIYMAAAEGTIDEDIIELLKEKMLVIDAATDGSEVETVDIMGELVKRIISKKG